MKILLCYYFRTDVPLGRGCLEALCGLGHEVVPFECDVRTPFDRWVIRPANKILSNLRIRRDQEFLMHSPWSNLSSRSRGLLHIAREFRPDLVIVMRGASFLPEVLREIKETGSSLLAYWWLKGPIKIYPDTIEEVRCCDLLLSTSRLALDEFRRQVEVPCYYLPLAVDPALHRRLAVSEEDRRKYDCDVAFVGTWQKARQQVIEHLLSWTSASLKIWGRGWKEAASGNGRMADCVQGRGIYGEEVVKLFNVARIGLNIHTWHGIPSGINGLAFEIPACGGMALLEHSDELSDIYRVGEEVESYASLEELVGKVEFYLGNPQARSRIAEGGYERVQRDHTFTRRMAQMIAAAEETRRVLG